MMGAGKIVGSVLAAGLLSLAPACSATPATAAVPAPAKTLFFGGEGCYVWVNELGTPHQLSYSGGWLVQGTAHAQCSPVPKYISMCVAITHLVNPLSAARYWALDGDSLHCTLFDPSDTFVKKTVNHYCTGVNPWDYATAVRVEAFNPDDEINEGWVMLENVCPEPNQLPAPDDWRLSAAREFYC